MKQRLKYLLTGVLWLVACSQSSQNHSRHDDTDTSTTPEATDLLPVASECYAYQENGDTIALTVIRANNQAEGTFVQKLKEKDSNDGIFKGRFYGDTLMAQYEFNSEGVLSVREIAFLKKGDVFHQGFGEIVQEENGHMVFKERSTLNFPSAMPLQKKACD